MSDVTTADKSNVIFLCTGNSARSQMAEGFLRTYAGNRHNVFSAGLEPKSLNPYAVQAMHEKGIDISQQQPSDVREYMGHMNFATIVTVCDHAEQNCPRAFLMSAGNHIHWSFEDPAAFEATQDEILAKFRQVRDQIDAAIRTWLADQGVPISSQSVQQ
jgi:arsenate reductase (thioredoxin)